MKRVVVIYEDSGQPGKAFGLHNLVVRCVHERLRQPPRYHELCQRLTGNPRGGNGKVINDVRNAEAFSSDGRAMVIVLDKDQAQPLLKATASCMTSLRAAVRQINAIPLSIFIDKNTETLIEVIRDSRQLDVSADVFRRALNKELDARDIVLGKAAGDDDHLHRLRNHLAANVPSFDYLVTKLVGLVGP